METKEDLITDTIRQLIRVSKMYARIEALPIRVDDDTEITTREAHAIQIIGEQKQMSVTGVAIHFGITKSGASQMVAKLANKGFLKKKQAPHSNKEIELSLTSLGWRAFDAHENSHGKDLADLIRRMSGFSLSQIATISVLLETIASVMEKRLSQRIDP